MWTKLWGAPWWCHFLLYQEQDVDPKAAGSRPVVNLWVVWNVDVSINTGEWGMETEDEGDVSDAAKFLLTSAAASNWPIGSSCGRGLGHPPPPSPPQWCHCKKFVHVISERSESSGREMINKWLINVYEFGSYETPSAQMEVWTVKGPEVSQHLRHNRGNQFHYDNTPNTGVHVHLSNICCCSEHWHRVLV